MQYQNDSEFIFDCSKFENAFKKKATPCEEGVEQTVLS